MMAKAEEGGNLVHMENLSGTMRPATFQHNTGRPGVVDLSGDGEDLRDPSLGGFLELLGFSSSLFDLPLHPPPPPPPLLTEITVPLPTLSWPAVLSELSNAANIPVTPNSCSISSSRTDAADVDHPRSAVTSDAEASADDGEEDEKRKPKQRSGAEEEKKKKGQKRTRGPRFAFVTRSEVDHLDDGYRWRKYGQKPVKNSPFPRSYYRCTSATCGVKKLVERSSSDPEVVVTTYEGRHTHPCPVGRRGEHNYALTTVDGGGVSPLMPPSDISTFSLLASPYHGQRQQQSPLYGSGLPPPLAFTFIKPDDGVGSGGFRGAQEGVNQSEPRWRPMHAPGGTGGDALVGDRGLLQDLIPHGVVTNGVVE